MSEKLIKINDSEKTRKDSNKGGILPNTFSHTDDGVTSPGEQVGCGQKMKNHKYKILGLILLLVLAAVLAITIHDDDDKPKPPGPAPPIPPVPPPVPPNKNYNMYFLSPNDTIVNKRHMVSGNLRWQMPNMTAKEQALRENGTI
jgi:hypothetical protein